jgi:hypothetical protein
MRIERRDRVVLAAVLASSSSMRTRTPRSAASHSACASNPPLVSECQM